MMCLKYPKPEVMTEVMPGGSVFFLPPQGKNRVLRIWRNRISQRLRSQVERRLGTLHRVVCQPQRVGQSSSVAVTAEGACGEVHLLLTVGGMRAGPSEEEYRHPRWYIRGGCGRSVLHCCPGCVMAGRKPEKLPLLATVSWWHVTGRWFTEYGPNSGLPEHALITFNTAVT